MDPEQLKKFGMELNEMKLWWDLSNIMIVHHQ